MKIRSFSSVVHVTKHDVTIEDVVDAIISEIKLRNFQRCIIYLRGFDEDDLTTLKEASHDAVATRYGANSKRLECFYFSTELSGNLIAISY